MSKAPNKLQVTAGVLHMIDGGNVRDYLKDSPVDDCEVVIVRREDCMRLVEDANKWRALSDERFAIAA